MLKKKYDSMIVIPVKTGIQKDVMLAEAGIVVNVNNPNDFDFDQNDNTLDPRWNLVMEKRIIFNFFSGLFFVLMFSNFSQANSADLVVENAQFKSFSLAFPSVLADPTIDAATLKSAQDLRQKVEKILQLSIAFSLLDPKAFLADHQKEGLTPVIERWRMSGADALAKLKINASPAMGAAKTIQLNMYWIKFAQNAKSIQIQADFNQSDRLARRIADLIYEFFIGEKSYLSMPILAEKKTAQGSVISLSYLGSETEEILTQVAEKARLPSIAPDGKSIFYTAYLNRRMVVYRLWLETRRKEIVSQMPGLNTGARLAPDLKTLLLTLSYEGRIDTYLKDLTTGKLRALAPAAWSAVMQMSASFALNNKIVFVSTRAGNPHIYQANMDGSAVQRLTFVGKFNQTPSSNGNYVVYGARDENNKYDLFLINLKDKSLTRITQGEGDNMSPIFSPDGKQILFISTRNGRKDLYTCDLNGQKQILVKSGNYDSPAWGFKI